MISISTTENLYSAWTNVSIILLTAALVFYHMTKVKSLHVPLISAMMVSCGLIFVDISYNLIGLIPYYTRTQKNYIKNYDEKLYEILCYLQNSIFII